ncbi:TRAP transporter 4TM/12TM fusion protein [Rhodobium orientis]|uniref:C4-dicarboxylate ABC transporter n=1 Tax=Rhodobium orientis TaxID=34017 RepID=A0A327JGB9_9HYPH|nr:TRAP transporter permease [Rhodobium orientis]MBB4301486.1 TRAP transporter 4TM/12TM fusion protein [Rhodobium orientis]MBK5952183.1 C4-dicarboxylate ABC transporter [Rhodobium orientis]RAI25450.1 C4-dicarboxylate ABC transporter [Rhodobium orientis]
MSDSNGSGTASKRPEIDVDELVAQVDSGARAPTGAVGLFVVALAFIWSTFQLYIASGVPFWLNEVTGLNVVFNNSEARIIHLAFAIALASLAYPLFRTSSRHSVPWYDWVLAILGAGACLYLIINKEAIANRAGLPTTADLIASTIGMLSLALAVYRTLGLPMLIVAGVFVFYVFFGHLSFWPDAIQWKGASFGKAMWHYWMQLEGVFGVALGVSASMIFLFVLFGALLEKAGAGNYFIKLAFALLGHLRGGPAKAAVVASAMSGLYSGSSIANTVTTGTFTIPLMKRTGFAPEKAGAVEVASSTNGQLTPPVMGAAAFLISEFTGISYTEIIKHALVPALVSYIALVYIVHLEALKLNLKGMEKPPAHLTLIQKLIGFLTGFIGIAALGLAVYYGLGWIKVAFPNMTVWASTLLFAAAYLILVFIAAKRPDLEVDDPDAPLAVLPRANEVALTGLHYLLPIVVLLWCILIERLSPALSAFWATVAMVSIVLTQHALKSIFRGEAAIATGLAQGVGDFVTGMIAGARNMVPIGVATGVAGVIIGTVSLTGLHQIVGEFVEFVSGGNLMVMLILVAVMSLVLGMGLPTTANYIVVSSLMAPVIVSVGAQSGLVVPLIACHMFVFYFGILADDTPPVGLAAFAAAAISGGDPIKTGLQGFAYDIRTALLPFMFIFNTEILLIDVTIAKAVFVFVIAVAAMMLFAAATQGYFFARSRIWESAILLVIAFTLLRPAFWLDFVQPPYDIRPGSDVEQIVEKLPPGAHVRLLVRGPDFDKPDKTSELTILADLGPAGDGVSRLNNAGLTVLEEGGKAKLDEPMAGTSFFTKFQMFDFYGDNPVEIAEVQLEAERMPKEIFYIPAVLLLIGVILLQRRRQTQPAF